MSSFPQQHGLSVSASSRTPSSAPAPSPQANAPLKHLLFNSGHENRAEQPKQDDDDDAMEVDALSQRSDTPIQEAQDRDKDEPEADEKPHESTTSSPSESSMPMVPPKCSVCGNKFSRLQERNRHLESYLPHSVHCPFQGCTWTGRRQWDFKEHWRRKHSEAGQAPGEDANEIYDPKDFVKSIVDGTPVEEVARSAFAEVQESLRRLGKPDVGANVLGRNRELRKWIRIPSSRVN